MNNNNNKINLHAHTRTHKHFKTCTICRKKIDQGTGTIYGRRLIHKTCKKIAMIQKNRLTP